MSTDTAYDPFDAPTEEPPADDVAFDEFDDIFASLGDLEETESGEEIFIPGAVKTYSNPIDAGLKDMQWVPIRILTATVEAKHIPRINSETCVVRKTGPDGKQKLAVLYDQVDAALKGGAEESIEEIPLPYFVVSANHASDAYGQRRFDYEIEVPVFTIKSAIYEKFRKPGKTGHRNESGRSLRQATGATETGDRTTLQNMGEIASRMVDTVIMAQITISTSKKAKVRDRLDASGNQISVLVNPEDGDPVTVFKLEDGTGYVFEGTGEVWSGREDLLVPIDGRLFAIRDDSESSSTLKEKYYPVSDYLKTMFKPVPDRKVKVELTNGTEVEGEVTLETVGAIAVSKTPGVHVDVMLRNGNKVTAVWLGTQWNEVQSTGGGLDEFSGGLDSL